MKQLYLLRLLTFIVLLTAYTIFFDPSFQQFTTALINLKDLNIHYLYLLNCIGWLMGMWGLVVFLNCNNHKLRISTWVIFMVTSLINYSYFKTLHVPMSMKNIDQFSKVISIFVEVNKMELLKFIIFSTVFIILAKYLKPLNISHNSIFLTILVAIIALTITTYAGSNIPLPSIYIITLTMIYKYSVLMLTLAKTKKQSGF